MLRIVNDAGDTIYEFSNNGFYGVVSNKLLIDIATGNLDKGEVKVLCYLLSTTGWDNKGDDNKGRGARVVGMTHKAYTDAIERLTQKKIIFVNEGYNINPEYFRRRAVLKKRMGKNIPTNTNFDQEEDDIT